MESIAERAARILERRPVPLLSLPELRADFRREGDLFVPGEEEIVRELRRRPDLVRVVEGAARAVPAIAGWPDADRHRYRRALDAACLSDTPHVVAVGRRRTAAGPGEETPGGHALPRGAPLLARLEETVRSLADEVVDAEPRSAVRWLRLAREARRVRGVVLGPGAPPSDRRARREGAGEAVPRLPLIG